MVRKGHSLLHEALTEHRFTLNALMRAGSSNQPNFGKDVAEYLKQNRETYEGQLIDALMIYRQAIANSLLAQDEKGIRLDSRPFGDVIRFAIGYIAHLAGQASLPVPVSLSPYLDSDIKCDLGSPIAANRCISNIIAILIGNVSYPKYPDNINVDKYLSVPIGAGEKIDEGGLANSALPSTVAAIGVETSIAIINLVLNADNGDDKNRLIAKDRLNRQLLGVLLSKPEPALAAIHSYHLAPTSKQAAQIRSQLIPGANTTPRIHAAYQAMLHGLTRHRQGTFFDRTKIWQEDRPNSVIQGLTMMTAGASIFTVANEQMLAEARSWATGAEDDTPERTAAVTLMSKGQLRMPDNDLFFESGWQGDTDLYQTRAALFQLRDKIRGIERKRH